MKLQPSYQLQLFSKLADVYISELRNLKFTIVLFSKISCLCGDLSW